MVTSSRKAVRFLGNQPGENLGFPPKILSRKVLPWPVTGPANCSEEGVTCTPTTCAQAQAQCGKLPDGCGDLLDCGTCPSPLLCGGAGIANQCGCKPITCKAVGANCGVLSDGCGTDLYCGNCPAELTCDPATHRCAMAM